jgi:hypothetical protein
LLDCTTSHDQNHGAAFGGTATRLRIHDDLKSRGLSMFGSNVLDIAIGLVFTYLILSLAVTAANELLATAFRSRARNLEQGIRNLLDENHLFPAVGWRRLWNRLPVGRTNAVVDPDRWSDRFFGHPLIKALSGRGKAPSYIPSQTFATVLMHLVKGYTPPMPQAVKEQAVKEQAAQEQLALPIFGLASFDAIRNSINLIDNTAIKAALLPLVEEARMDMTDGVAALKKVNDRIEAWYDQTMVRVSGWYKQRTQWCLLGFAVLFSAFLDVDSVAICSRLGKDATLRESLVAAAGQATANKNGTADGVSHDLSQVVEAVKQLDGLGIPLGWNNDEAFRKLWNAPDTTWREWTPFGGTKLMGLLLTALAASLGAPFWFDVLNKFMSVRGSGEAPEEMSKTAKKSR